MTPIAGFQFYEALCAKSGQYDETDPSKPLFLCDFSLGGSETGALIKYIGFSLLVSNSWAPFCSIHIFLKNLSRLMECFAEAYPKVHLHITYYTA